MLKVFLVEDEIVVRESLRDNFPWGDYGYEFAGKPVTARWHCLRSGK